MRYHCKKCDTTKDFPEFPKNKHSPTGRDWKCKKCHRESWHARKPAPAFIPYPIPEPFIPNQRNVRELFDITEDGDLVWRVDAGANARKGMLAGDRTIPNGRVLIRGKRFTRKFLIAIHETGSEPEPNGWKTREERAYEAACMRDIRSHSRFPDWSYEWQKEKGRRKAGEYSRIKYAAMTEDVRRKVWRERDQRRDKIAKREYTAKWKSLNPEKVKEFARRHNTNPKHKPKRNLRNRFKELMGTTRKGGSMSFSRIIGCTTKQLASYLDAQFTKRMTWDNYGTYWHVDHILPVSSFDHIDPNQVRMCWHWTNLRPMTAKKNLEKRDKINEPQMSLLLPC